MANEGLFNWSSELQGQRKGFINAGLYILSNVRRRGELRMYILQYCYRPSLTKLGTIFGDTTFFTNLKKREETPLYFNISFPIRLNSLSNRMEGRWPNKVLSYKEIKKQEKSKNSHYRGWLTSSSFERVVCVHLPSSNSVLSRKLLSYSLLSIRGVSSSFIDPGKSKSVSCRARLRSAGRYQKGDDR